MAATDIEICNIALAMIGSRSITTLAENSKEAKLCNIWYLQSLIKLQEAHRWGFCLKREELTATGTDPVWEYTTEFALPSTYLRLLKIEDEPEYQREGEFLYTYSETINILYIQKITDVTKFPPSFVQALACEIASMIVYSLQQDKNLKAMMLEEAEYWKARARSTGAMESSSKGLEPKTFINARY